MTQENKFPYQVVFHTSEAIFNSEESSIEGSISLDNKPSEDELLQRMKEYNSTFCEVYFDVDDNEEYNELLFALKA